MGLSIKHKLEIVKHTPEDVLIKELEKAITIYRTSNSDGAALDVIEMCSLITLKISVSRGGEERIKNAVEQGQADLKFMEKLRKNEPFN